MTSSGDYDIGAPRRDEVIARLQTDARPERIWDLAPELFGILDETGVFRHTNPAWHTVLGWQPEEVESRRFDDLLHPDDVEGSLAAFDALKEGKAALHFENRFRHKDGSYVWLSWNAIPDGGIYYCTARDVSDAKENQSSLDTSREQAQLREQFIAVLGHDLRNPLAALRAGVRMLEREELSDRGTVIIRESEQSIKRMFDMIDDLMDFARSRLGSGVSLDIEENANLAATLEAVLQEIAVAHPEAQIDSDIAIEGPIRCDAARISQLTSNLLANAVTHGDATAPISLRARGEGEDLEISVINSGEPIPEAVREGLFEPFVREEVRPSQEGLGLGLFISSEIAKAHGGSISVKSDADGTRFTFLMGKATV
ncbi:MAG: PAS domain-containing protein [Erythrobacter sp.]|nr:PAS domain-containing protein [Erythrobacter sp.]NCQ62388.1 PAS domain-containing protein [Alphaproteobacteria bacterium]